MQSTADAPMLDPAWTPARGYSHAANLLALANRAEAKPSTVCPCGGTLDRFGRCTHARAAAAQLVARVDHYERQLAAARATTGPLPARNDPWHGSRGAREAASVLRGQA